MICDAGVFGALAGVAETVTVFAAGRSCGVLATCRRPGEKSLRTIIYTFSLSYKEKSKPGVRGKGGVEGIRGRGNFTSGL